MTWEWELFEGSGEPHRPDRIDGIARPMAYHRLPPLPRWRTLTHREEPPEYVLPPGLANAVNAALHLRRPLLLTGSTGTGKSTLMELLACELEIKPVLRWHITSKTVLADGLYSFDALDRLHATEKDSEEAPVEDFVTLGPLGTALASDRPRAVLIDEIDKSDLDLPGDLLNVLEVGEFEIPPLIRATKRIKRDAAADPPAAVSYRVRGYDGEMYDVGEGKVNVGVDNYPIIVFTSNQERTFAPPFLRRCVRFRIEPPTAEQLGKIVANYVAVEEPSRQEEIERFAARLANKEELAVNQLIELVHLVAEHPLTPEQQDELRELLLKELTEQ